jgi:hypothetical protein
MGFLDFLFGKKKDDEPRRSQQTATSTQSSSSQRQSAPVSSSRPSNNTVTEKTIEPFVFKSNCHQRYQNGSEVMGLQQCIRTVRVEKNTNGCSGYRLSPGDGYIVKIYNDDLGKPNMSDKPMRIVSKTSTKVELRGFPIEAQTPFGWQEVDYRDYGFTIYYTNGKVSKCVLHMFDRNVDLEYRQTAAQSNDSSVKSAQSKASSNNSVYVEKPVAQSLAEEALSKLQMGIDGDAVYHPLYKAWRAIQSDPSCLKKITNDAVIGNGLFVFISFGTVSDIDDRQQIISLSYLFISKALENRPSDINLVKNRLVTMLNDKEAFQYTVSSVVNKDSGFDFMGMSQFHSRDALLKMIYADLTKSPALRSIPLFNSTFIDLENKINNNFFGQNQSKSDIVREGNKLHQDVISYLRDKVLVNEDIDF